MKQVSIIVRCKDNWELTEKCLNSIIKNTDSNIYQLVVVDDGSDDGTTEELIKMESKYKNFKSLHHHKSKGAVSATNTGLEFIFKNSTPYILIMDNDTEVMEDNTTWLTDMIKYFEEDECIGAVGACSNKVIGTQHVVNTHLDVQPKFLISFCLMISLKCAKKVGLWDEIYNPGNCEDLDFSIRAIREGFTLKVAKDVFIIHHCHKTFEKMGIDNLVEVNERKLLAKWGELIYYQLRS